jgi:hypothetical protein
MLLLALSHTPISTIALSVRKSYIMKCLVDNMANVWSIWLKEIPIWLKNLV